MAVFPVPRHLAETASRDPAVRGWLAQLPALVADLAGRWALRLGAPFEPGGHCSWVAPVVNGSDAVLVLKVGFRSQWGEERDEAAGLRCWDGNGAVRLHGFVATEAASALLLERCEPGMTLRSQLPEPGQDEVVAGLLHQLWAQPMAGDPFRPLAQMCAEWADEFEAANARASRADKLDAGLAAAGIELFRSLPRTASRQVLLCTDLHGHNILAARRAPWLAIDPKPYVGDPAYDVLQHMLNCESRLAADPAGLAGRMAGLTGLETSRVRQWLFARSVQESVRSPLMRHVATLLAP